MEKRNFVTPIRTSDDSAFGDSLVSSAASLFGGRRIEKHACFSSDLDKMTKKACAADIKSDTLD